MLFRFEPHWVWDSDYCITLNMVDLPSSHLALGCDVHSSRLKDVCWVGNLNDIRSRWNTTHLECAIGSENKNNSQSLSHCVNHGICDSVKTVLFCNQSLDCDNIITLGRLLRSF